MKLYRVVTEIWTDYDPLTKDGINLDALNRQVQEANAFCYKIGSAVVEGDSGIIPDEVKMYFGVKD